MKKKNYITIIVHYLYIENIEDELYRHGTITKIEENSFSCVLDNDKTKEEYFTFADIKNIIPGHMIPFLAGLTTRMVFPLI
ncbi:hypothetical protein [Bacillus mycoides]|uniref:hypothetical protein n=1 Tax=Bacillus mycoides TaxID=1405 RepID=UPI0019CF83B4|nr:hypothetical protein [Bacillus mycoides]